MPQEPLARLGPLVQPVLLALLASLEPPEKPELPAKQEPLALLA